MFIQLTFVTLNQNSFQMIMAASITCSMYVDLVHVLLGSFFKCSV